jgi:tetratricopeptide (TPR) repeat protein
MIHKRPTLAELQRAVTQAPQDAALSFLLGTAHTARREFDEALGPLTRATQLDPTQARYFFRLAEVLGGQEQRESAIAVFRAGLKVLPDARATVMLGYQCERIGDVAGAVGAYAKAIEHAPLEAAGYECLCGALVAGRTAEEALALACARAPVNADAVLMRVGVALALERHGRYSESQALWTSVLDEVPEHQHAILGAANARVVLGDLEAAERLFLQGLALHPTSVGLIVSHANLLFRTGRIDALRAFLRDSRSGPIVAKALCSGHPQRAPMWDGTQDLEGKAIFVNCVGGFGDALQYSRFAPLLKGRGAWVIVQAYPQLASLLRSIPGIDEIVAPFDECTPYQYECAPGHAGFLMDWTWEWISGTVPYLRVDPARRRAWSRRFDRRRFNVGIVWRSRHADVRNPYTFRSAPLSAFEALARVPGIAIHGLQVGPGCAELEQRHERWLVANLERECTDFVEAAAAIQALDAVVSVDTGVAHLAGALGRPGFFVLPRHPCDRWMTDAPTFDGASCVWYPSARLYVQERPGDWDTALARVAEDLAKLATVVLAGHPGHGPVDAS